MSILVGEVDARWDARCPMCNEPIHVMACIIIDPPAYSDGIVHMQANSYVSHYVLPCGHELSGYTITRNEYHAGYIKATKLDAEGNLMPPWTFEGVPRD